MNTTDENKVKYFNEISANYFSRNFGMFSKSEMDLLMFKFFIENLENSSAFISDYEISRQLGITQSRVKNLRIKKDLIYGSDDFSWKDEFIKYTKYAKFDKTTERVTINIIDPVVHIELQHYIEEMGLYNETQLNSKLFQLKISYYIDILVSFEESQNRIKITEEIVNIANEQISSNEKKIKSINKEKLSKVLLENGINFTTLAVNLMELSTGSALIAPAIKAGLSFLN